MPSSYAVGKHFEQFIKEQIKTGRYASASEVVRDALRLLQEEDRHREATLEALRGEIAKGIESGKGKPAGQALDRLERKYAKMARPRGRK